MEIKWSVVDAAEEIDEMVDVDRQMSERVGIEELMRVHKKWMSRINVRCRWQQGRESMH